MGTAAEVVASDILVGGQPRIRRWARARSSGSELVDTATAQRQQREEDAARGTAVPPERRGRGATSVAMKWRDAVKAAIMHGPLPPDVTLDAPYWWQPGMPLLPPVDNMAPVPLKRKHDTSAEPKTDPAKRTYMRIPDEAKLWFVDFHACQARVHGKSLAYNIRRAKHQAIGEFCRALRNCEQNTLTHHIFSCFTALISMSHVTLAQVFRALHSISSMLHAPWLS